MKIYSIIITVLFILTGILAYNYYSQISVVKSDLLETQNQLQQTRSELNNLRLMVDNDLNSVKSSSALLNDSLASFLIAGDIKISSLSDTMAQKISSDIQNITNVQDKVALEQGWNDFLKSRKIGDYIAFSRFLIQNIQNNLGNLR